MRVAELVTLYDYYYWATKKILAQAEKVTAEQWAGPPPIGDRSLQAMLDPLIVSWGWQSDHPGPSSFIDYFQWLGTDDPAAFLSVPAAIDFQVENDWPEVRAACHRLGQAARNEILALSGLPEICPDSEEWWMQMFTAPLPPCNPREVGQRLWEEFQVEVPVSERDRAFQLA